MSSDLSYHSAPPSLVYNPPADTKQATPQKLQEEPLLAIIDGQAGAFDDKHGTSYSNCLPDYQINEPKADTGSLQSTWLIRLGKSALLIIVFSPLAVIASISWLAFLWFATDTNSLRHTVLVQGWLTISVTICSLIIRTAVGLQSGICTSMLAALVLERSSILLADSATVSLMRPTRNSNMLIILLLKILKALRRSRVGAVLLAVVTFILLLVTTIIQFGSVILISDISVAQIPGLPSHLEIAYGFNYSSYKSMDDMPPYYRVVERQGTWFRKAPFYPAFAEYSEEPYVDRGVSDTGLTLRAFIPSSSAPARESLQNYSGSTTVLDARVTCQVPYFQNVFVTVGEFGSMNLSGQVWPTRATPRLDNSTVRAADSEYFGIPQPSDLVNNSGVGFICSTPNNSTMRLLQWRTSMCQLGSSNGAGNFSYSGSLVSEFEDITTRSSKAWHEKFGTAYLVLNISSGFADDWAAMPQTKGVAPHSSQERSEWLDLMYDYGNLNLSLTLCYSGFSIADLPITMFSASNRTEPSPSYNFNLSIATFDNVRKQLGQNHQAPLEDRGVMRLERKASWITNKSYVSWDYIPMFADFRGQTVPLGTSGSAANYTALLWDFGNWVWNGGAGEYIVSPDTSIISFFQEVVHAGGSIAFAIQATLTILSGMAYYDQFPQFDNFGPTASTYFVSANVPTSQRGFTVIVTVLYLHLLLVVAITVAFLTICRLSSLHTDWQAVAQVVTADAEDILAIASAPSGADKNIKKRLRESGRDGVMVKLGHLSTDLELRPDTSIMWRRRVGLVRA